MLDAVSLTLILRKLGHLEFRQNGAKKKKKKKEKFPGAEVDRKSIVALIYTPRFPSAC